MLVTMGLLLLMFVALGCIGYIMDLENAIVTKTEANVVLVFYVFALVLIGIGKVTSI